MSVEFQRISWIIDGELGVCNGPTANIIGRMTNAIRTDEELPPSVLNTRPYLVCVTNSDIWKYSDLYLPLPRGPVPHEILEQIAEAIHTIRQLTGRKIVVHCDAARERSPLVAAYYMWAFSKNVSSFDEAYKFVRNRHTDTWDVSGWITNSSYDGALARMAKC